MKVLSSADMHTRISKAGMGMKAFRKKLNQKSGFSLAETLVTVAIISLVCTGLVGISGTVRDIYNRVVRRADAETLLSTAVTAMKADLSSAVYVDVDTTAVSEDGYVAVTDFYSEARGQQIAYENSKENGVIVVYVANKDKPDKLQKQPLLTKKTMPGGLYTEIEDGTVTYKKGVFSFKLVINDKNDNEVISQKIRVRSYNVND